MTKKIIFTMMALLTMMATTSCKEEQKTTEDPNDGFVTINESWNDGWSGSNVKTWDDVDKEVEEQILTERIITEQIITEEIIVETTVTETYSHENFEPEFEPTPFKPLTGESLNSKMDYESGYKESYRE